MALPRPRTTLDWVGTAFLAFALVAFVVIWTTMGPSKQEKRAARQAASSSSSSAAASSSSASSSSASSSSASSSSSAATSDTTSATSSTSKTSSPSRTIGANERPLVAGPTISAARFTSPPTIDGLTSGDAWRTAKGFTTAEQVGGNGKPAVSAAWRLGYDSTNLYLLAAVKDKAITQTHTLRPHLIGTGDVVGMEIGDFRSAVRTDAFSAKEVKFFIGPLESGGVTRTLLVAKGEEFVPGSPFTAGSAAIHRNGSGYVVEAAIPWSAVGQKAPKPGTTLAANALLADAVSSGSTRGRLNVLLSNNAERTGNSNRYRYTWGVLELTR